MMMFHGLMRTAVMTVAAAAVVSLTGCGALVAPKEGVSRAITEQPASKAVAEPRRDNASALRLAHLLIEQGRLEGALGVYAELDKKGALKPRELLEYANVAALTNPPRATLALFTRLKALADDETTGREFSDKERSALLTGLGRAQLASGQTAAAETSLTEAVKANEANAVAWNARGVLWDAEGRHIEAQEAFRRALAVSPADAKVLNNWGLSLLSAGDARGAVKRLTEAASYDEENDAVKLNLALAQYFRGAPGDYGRAKTGLETFLSKAQAAEFMKTFAAMKARVRAGESTMAEELVRSSEKLVTLRPKNGDAVTESPVIEVTPEDFKPAATAKTYPLNREGAAK